VDPKLEFFSPKKGDPADYVAVRLASGKRVTITNSCAANVLGLVKPEHFSYGSAGSARKAMQPLADHLGLTVEEVATQILQKAYEKIEPVIMDLAEKYRLEHDQISLVGVGGGAASLICYSADKMKLRYSIPENAEVISSIGVALAMVRDVVERIMPNPSQQDIKSIKQEAMDKAIGSGASPDSVEVHIEIDPQTSKVTAIAMGSTEVKTTDLLKECTQEEALELARADFGLDVQAGDIELLCETRYCYVYGCRKGEAQMVRIMDKKGFIKVQRANAQAVSVDAEHYKDVVKDMWDSLSFFKTDSILRPDYYLCIGAKVMDFAGSIDLEQIYMLMDLEVADLDSGTPILVVGAVNQA